VVYSTNKTLRHDVTEIMLKVVLNTITLTHIFLAQQMIPILKWLCINLNMSCIHILKWLCINLNMSCIHILKWLCINLNMSCYIPKKYINDGLIWTTHFSTSTTSTWGQYLCLASKHLQTKSIYIYQVFFHVHKHHFSRNGTNLIKFLQTNFLGFSICL
jgi:hypothetical protein